MKTTHWLALLAALTIGTGNALATDFDGAAWQQRVARADDVDRLAELLVELRVEFNPIEGTQLGLHGTDTDPVRYDSRLPDLSAQTFADRYDHLVFYRDRLAALDVAGASRAARIDHHILTGEVALEILQLTELGEMTSPLGYVGALGAAFNGLILRDYAPVEQRLRAFGERCRQTPRLLAQARANLTPPYVRPTALQKEMAPKRLQGLAAEGGMFDRVLPQLLESSGLDAGERRGIEEACDTAKASMASFGTWFGEAMATRADGEWRLGAELFARKYALYMDYPLGPDELLAVAEQALENRHADLVAVARRVHDEFLADRIAAEEILPEATLEDAVVVRQVMAELAEDRSTIDSLIEDSYALADAIVGFVEANDIMELPPTSKLRIENIPPHLSGTAVAMIQTAPPFEPELESVWFWDLPLLANAESYLKEYNRPMLAEVYIHEGVPGHFVQLEYSNAAPRLVPRVFINGPMVEGWASYIQTQMVDQGFTVYPDRALGRDLQKVANLKLQLRAITNAILDIRLHTQNWSEEEALALLVDKAFQEEGEARGKITRAKLSSVQLSSYFAGHHAILQILDEYRAAQGEDFRWKDFNERLVSAGSPPFFAVREHMLSGD